MRYEEVKALIKEKCHLTNIIVDNLVLETTLTRKVTIGLSDDNDAAIVFKELNGLVLGGRKIVVEDPRKNKVYYFKVFFKPVHCPVKCYFSQCKKDLQSLSSTTVLHAM